MSESGASPAGPWPVVAVIGGGDAEGPALEAAAAVGAVAISLGAAVLTGGRGGVMAAASRGAREARGAAAAPPVIALLPGYDRAAANPHADLVLPTGLGHARNTLVVAAADVVVGIGGGPGTLSELGLARKLGRPVLLLAWTGGVAGRGAAALPDDPGVESLDDLDALEARLRARLSPGAATRPPGPPAGRPR